MFAILTTGHGSLLAIARNVEQATRYIWSRYPSRPPDGGIALESQTRPPIRQTSPGSETPIVSAPAYIFIAVSFGSWLVNWPKLGGSHAILNHPPGYVPRESKGKCHYRALSSGIPRDRFAQCLGNRLNCGRRRANGAGRVPDRQVFRARDSVFLSLPARAGRDRRGQAAGGRGRENCG